MAAALLNTNVDHKYPRATLTLSVALQVGDVMVLCTSSAAGTQGTATWTGAGSGTFVNQAGLVGSSAAVTILTGVIATAGTPVITVSNDSDMGFTVLAYRGLTNGAAHKSGSASSTANPLVVSLSPTVDCLLVTAWGSETADNFTSFTASQTTFQHDTGHFDASGYNLLVAGGGGPFSCGVNLTTGATSQTMVAVMLPIAATGIAFDASSNSGDQSSVSTFTFSRTVTLANPFLAVDVGLLSTPGTTVTSVIDDFGGGNVNVPFIGSQVATALGLIAQFGLANPASGTKTIQVNLSASITSGAVATIYGNVDQIEPTEAFNSAQGLNVGAANATVTVTPVTDKTWIHAATVTNDTTATNTQTSRGTVTDAILGRVLAEDNNAAVTPAAATTMTAAIAAAKTWAIAGYAIKPTGAADLFAQICL